MVEFAIIALGFFFLIVGMLDVGRGVMTYSTLGNAAREATRHAIVHGERASTPATASDIAAFARQKLPGMQSAVITTTWDPDNAQGSEVTVNITYSYDPLVSFLGSVPLQARSKMIVSY